MKISIKQTLILAFAILSIAVIGLVGRSLLQEVSVYRNNAALSKLSRLDGRLFDALLGLRGERGALSSAAKLEPADMQSTLANLQDGRQSVDPAFAEVKSLLEDVRVAEINSAVGKVMGEYAQWMSLRQQVDGLLKQPLADRDAALVKQVLGLADQMLVDLEQASNAVEAVIIDRDPKMMMFTQLRALGWSMRANGGAANSTLVGSLIANAPPSAAKQTELAVQDGKVAFAWAQIGQIVLSPSTPDEVTRAYKTAETTFFGGAYADQKAAALKAFADGKALGMDVDLWRKPAGPAQQSLADIAMAALTQMNAITAGKLSASAGAILLGAIALALTLALSVAGILTVIFRVTNPIGQLTDVMRKLADGDLSVIVTGAGRRDEIGEMARAVEVFKTAAEHNLQLEAQAETQRKAAEQERISFQQKAEREAEERLTQATSGLASGLKALAAGNMACEIHDAFSEQFEQLRHNFNDSVRQLRTALEGVNQTALSVRTGSGEISGASEELSKRTEQQAASLEETAAALEEVTTNVRQTSERASEAREMVRDASQRAGNSSTVVTNAVAAMNQIEVASSQISSIIGVIDDIAFQTNLLALNAGVEAARAGDAGKGFAVVAQEVRELAQRSANAAKEIKALISNSEAAVTQGVTLVNDTGAGLKEIAELVGSINQHMEAIATAAKEQSSGLAEINTAVNHMDQATQQNAAMVEEMNAAGVGLADESNRLSQLLARFDLDGSGARTTLQRADRHAA
ncbi:methyl-accepting chemotaxis protein [Rhizobium halophytocola]|uniref:Methyl-accepting chemotaxis protein n=1 Tax=Rhizobium halophytocola TaxID=735519 RepID=A0ABS4E5E0_9HYPH|nr:HAMP domain-containing methyl-accepting chemotaxis protein [Rhizobium halophytocola]MBP1853165.1 methyl-accepting chemotaxis protein [Rhizobium halophytocola]